MRLYTARFAVMCLTPLCLFSQTPAGTQPVPPGFVDGSKYPAQIPDYASYRLLMIHLSSVMSSTAVTAESRQAATFARIGLSDADTQILKSQVTAFGTSYSQWLAKFSTSPSSTAVAAANSIVLATRDALLKELSPDGVSKFAQYLQQEKAHMIVRP